MAYLLLGYYGQFENYMKKSLTKALGITVVGMMLAFPALAQVAPVDQCTLVDDINFQGIVVNQGSIVSGNPSDPSITTMTSPVGGPGAAVVTSDWGSLCLVNTVNQVVDWLFFILITLAVVLIVIAAFMWLTSQGDAAKQKTAQGMIVAALVGIVIALLAQLLPAIVIGIVA